MIQRWLLLIGRCLLAMPLPLAQASDRRVDAEHHGLSEPEHQLQQWASVVGFLRQHLAD